MVTLDDIARELRGYRFAVRDEDGLQVALHEILSALAPCEREVRVPAGRLDLLVDGCIAVEVKVAGSRAAVERQLRRYAAIEHVTGLVLVTTVAQHRTIGPTIGGKPLVVVPIIGGL